MANSLHTHGGKRKGARRPPFYAQAMKHRNIRLDDQTIAFYTQQGNGNLSKGIRDYWRKVQKQANGY